MLLSKYSTICYIINEISLPNSNSPHPKEEVLDSSMALPFTCYRQYALLRWTSSPSPSAPTPFPWKYIKIIFPGGLTQETGSALYRIAQWDRFKDCYLFQISAGDWARLIRSQNSPTVHFDSTWTQSLTSRNLKTGDVIREIREVKHHVYVKRQTRICTTWPSFPFACRLYCSLFLHIN